MLFINQTKQNQLLGFKKRTKLMTGAQKALASPLLMRGGAPAGQACSKPSSGSEHEVGSDT